MQLTLCILLNELIDRQTNAYFTVPKQLIIASKRKFLQWTYIKPFTKESVRLFKKEAIPDDKLKIILDAGRWAPTGCNKQLFEVVLIEDSALRKQVARLSNNQIYFYQAPVVILVLYDESKELEPKGVAPDVPAISSGAFVQNMMLQAHALGIGSLAVSAITKKKELTTFEPTRQL